ncbi:MAG: hypothetical protein WC790_02320 [Candidatus Paceibacterota bacterium]|jgi:hypothetical protein
MSASPTTPSPQEKHLDRMVALARTFAIREINPDHDAYQRLAKRQGELNTGLTALLRHLMGEVPVYALAKSILGGDFITVGEIMAARPDITYSFEQVAKLAATIPSEDVLRSLKENGYGLMPRPPKAISLLDIRSTRPSYFYSRTGGWYADQAFARDDMTGSGWLAIKKTPVNGSLSKNWDEQNKLLSNVEQVPNVVEMSWFITIFFDVRGVRPFEKVYVRTNSLGSGGTRVYVGFFDVEGLGINDDLDDDRDDHLGLASARKF